MDWLLETILLYPRRSVAGITMFVLAGACFVWWAVVWQSPQHAFEDMLANNLTTTSVTRSATAGAGSQNIEQIARLEMGTMNAADWIVTAKQAGSTVMTENIGTPTGGYIRYIRITSAQKTKNGKAFDFSPAVGVWGKSDGVTDTALNDLFSQTLLDISSVPAPPIGNLPSSQQENILAYMRTEQIFVPDYAKVKRETINGRGVYTFPVAVKLGAYVRMMQAFAHDLGLTDLDTIDPSQYSTVPPLDITMSVDRASHELARITYPTNGFSQTYAEWGLITQTVIPSKTITTTELQQRILDLSSQKS